MATDLTDDLAKRLAQHDGCSRFGTVDYALLEAVRLTRGTPPRLTALADAIKDAKAALVGDSNDAEHDALHALITALGYEVPDCECDQFTVEGTHEASCPQHAWEKPNECQHMTGYSSCTTSMVLNWKPQRSVQRNVPTSLLIDRRVISAGRGRE